ncbi:ABC transporter permease [Ulvibacterium marinum]|uniref:ABC transporter permease n=1 Tax=Ulvibacterium marinum TaxID=2419782 RepID=UPI002494D6A8|nr:ABC transporter permease [Ulvibacterium marinum]
MFKQNIKLFFRNIRNSKSVFFINIIGLSTGLACVLLIFLWITDELKVDKFHEKDSQLYQVMHNRQFPDYITTSNHTPILLAEALVEEIPEIESAVAVSSSYHRPEGVLINNNKHLTANGLFVSENYFDVFSYELIKGDTKQVLTAKNNIVLSEELALKMFGSTENIIGKTVEWSYKRFEGAFQVSGIFENPPTNSTSQFDFVFNIELLLDHHRDSREWYSSNAETFLILKKGTNIENLNVNIADFMKGKHSLQSERSNLFVQQFSRKYLYGQYENGIRVGGRIAYVRLFSIVALFILTIAGINFMNLSTAQASRKMKEIGVKKVIGASRNTLISQFLGESILMANLSLVVAIGSVILLLPRFNEITGKELYLNFEIGDILILGSIVWFTGLVAGCYPAFYLSGLNPVTGLKGKRNTSSGEQRIRKSLVIIQFTISIVFIIGFLVMNEQIEFTQAKNLGYNRDNIISFERKGKIDNNDFDVFMPALKNIPGVMTASVTLGDFIEANSGNTSFLWEGKTQGEQKPFPSPEVGYDFIEMLDIEMKEGRSFSKEYADEGSKIIVNEAAVKMIGFEEPIGKNIKYGNEDRQIIGVVKNFHYGSLHKIIEPLFFRFIPHGKTIMLKIKSGTERATIERIEVIYKKFHPTYPFEFTFMDDDYQALYDSENRIAVLSKYFSIIAIIISCLGLFGLATYTTERRRKEISIRKVLGQSATQVTAMLSGEFAKLISVSILIAMPIAFLLAQNWLSGFAYRIALQFWYFLGAGLMALVIAMLTVGGHAIGAANKNPVDGLREE